MNKIIQLPNSGSTPPLTLNGKVKPTPPAHQTNAERRSREYLTPREVDDLMSAAGRTGRHGHRDKTLILIAFRHGLRVSELVNLRWEMIDLQAGLIHINRLKNGVPSIHPIRGAEIRALRRVKRDYPDADYVFVTERKGPMTTATVRKLVARAGEVADLPFPVHPDTSLLTTGKTLGQYNIIWAIETSSTPFDIQSYHRTDFKISGKIEIVSFSTTPPIL